MLTKLLVTLMLSSGLVAASATLELKGEIDSFSPKEVQIRTSRKIYRIDRSAISKNQSEQIEKPGQVLTLVVPLEAITEVRPSKNAGRQKKSQP